MTIAATLTDAKILQPDPNLIKGAVMSSLEKAFIINSGRSWWQVRYESGKILSEWQTKQNTRVFLPTAAKGGTTRWEDITKQGIRGLYLLCPGFVGALESNGDYQFFQLKVGEIRVAATPVGASFGKNESRTIEAHIIGKVDSDNGDCTCWAWEYETKQLVRFTDNVTNMQYRGIGALSLGKHTGVR